HFFIPCLARSRQLCAQGAELFTSGFVQPYCGDTCCVSDPLGGEFTLACHLSMDFPHHREEVLFPFLSSFPLLFHDSSSEVLSSPSNARRTSSLAFCSASLRRRSVRSA